MDPSVLFGMILVVGVLLAIGQPGNKKGKGAGQPPKRPPERPQPTPPVRAPRR